jgi:hypothetical protein
MALRKFSLVRGDSQTYTLTFKDSVGSPLCLKNWALHFTLKTNHDLPDADASLQKIVTSFGDSTGGTTGIALIELLPTDTVNLEPGEYAFDIQAVTSESKIYTILRGLFEILYDVTRTPGTAGTAA